MITKNMNIKITIVLLWITMLFNMLFADIFSIMVEIVEGGVVDIPGDVKTIMAIAAVVTNIPVLMIILTWVLPYKINRIANIIAAVFTIIYIIGGMAALPHYYIIAFIEIILLLVITFKVVKWKNEV